jgi:hypothetical protein
MAILKILLPALLLGAGAAQPQAVASLEQQVKAAYLYNFAKFVEWPPSAALDSNALLVCVVGDDAFAGVLDQTVQGKTANGRPVTVRRDPDSQRLKACHILFIGAAEQKRLSRLLEAVAGSGVLTVSEAERFAHLGGIINFIVEGNKVQFEVNVDAAARSRLRISSRLLQVARVVRDEGK